MLVRRLPARLFGRSRRARFSRRAEADGSCTRVRVPCRLRVGATWSDGCIHAFSAHALLIAAEVPPARGTAVCVRRGALMVAGRVVWQREQEFGVYSAEPIDRTVLLDAGCGQPITRMTERRMVGRGGTDERAHRFRAGGAMLQFATLACAGALAAAAAGHTVHGMLAAPLASVATSLRGG